MAFDDSILAGSTSKIVEVMMRDSTTGAGKTSLAHGDVTASYVREGGTRTAITLASGTAGDSYSSGKWAAVDGTNTPGLYQLHLPNAAIASGAAAVTVFLKASGTIDKSIRIKLVAHNVQDSVRMGLTSLPNAAASASNGLITNGTGTGQIALSGGALKNLPVQVYVAPHGDDDLYDGLSPGEPKATLAAACTVARTYPGSWLNIFGGKYDLGTTPNVLFCYETYTQFAGLTEATGGNNTTFTVAGAGTENYDVEGDDNYIIGSRVTPTTGAAAGTLYRVTACGYDAVSKWEFTVTPNFGGNYAANISGKTLVVTRERVRTGVSVRALGPVEITYAGLLVTAGQGPCWIPGEGSDVGNTLAGPSKFGIVTKLTGVGFQALVGEYIANNNTINANIYGVANYNFGNMGSRDSTNDESDAWYDNYNRSADSLVGIYNFHGRADWDSGRQFSAANRTVYAVDSSFVSIGPTALGGSGQNESRGYAMSGGKLVAANTDFRAEAGTDGSYAIWMEGGSTTVLLPGCTLAYSGTGKKIKLGTGSTLINATGQSIATGDRDTASGTYSEVDVETREESPVSRIATSPADIRMVQTKTPPTANVAGVLPVDAFAVSGDSVAADRLESQFDGTGLTGSTYPARQDASFGSGGGARTVLITVNDGSTALSSVNVRVTKGSESYTNTTNGSGVATFNLDDGTWTVALTKSGYTYAGTSLVVNGAEAETYSMTAVTITPASDPAQTTAYLTTRNGQGTAKGNVAVKFRLMSGPGDAGSSYDGAEFTAQSNTSGLLEVTLLREAIYVGTRGDGAEVQFTTPDASTYQLPEWLGVDA